MIEILFNFAIIKNEEIKKKMQIFDLRLIKCFLSVNRAEINWKNKMKNAKKY